MSRFKSDPSERRIDRALQHVLKPWFPINQDVLTRVRSRFKQGDYAREPNELLQDLKADFALFTLVVKELIHVGKQENVPGATLHNPIELIKWAGPGRIQLLVENDKKLPATHSLHWSEPFQISRLRETAISATTASLLSEKKNLDPDMGFARGVVREIGLNLIAWNYPSLYSKAVEALQPGQSLDEELSKELGFTPTLLAMRIMRPDMEGADPEVEAVERQWNLYDDLCEIGEALARAEHPETYPSAENDWQKAREFLSETVGEDAIQLVKDRAQQQAKSYERSLPATFGTMKSFNPDRKIKVHKKITRVIDAALLRQCPHHVQTALQDLYGEMDGETVSRSAVETLIKRIIPQAGFTGGCVFVIDPSTATLKPRTIIGHVSLRSTKDVELDPKDHAVEALSKVDPVIIEPSNSLDHAALAGIYRVLGEQRKVGVLYLESPAGQNPEASRDKTLITFEAMRRALSDVLLLQ
jgi:hypothetical protein